MDYVIKESKTIDEALESALKELNVEEDDVIVEVLEEPSRGFLGLIGSKDAKIKVTISHNAEEIAEEFIEKILYSMGIDGSYKIEKEKNILSIQILDVDPSKKGIIIGKRGNTLDAIQYLISLAVNKDRSSYMKVLVDVGDYRNKRKKTLERLAIRMAEKSISIKKPIKLEPMNAYERKIIHSALQDKEGITTYSEGNEPYRRVVIKSK